MFRVRNLSPNVPDCTPAYTLFLMKVRYDQRTDTLTMLLREDVAVAESDEEKPGVILDYDENGNLVSIEVLDASLRVTEARKVDFQTIP